MMTRVLLQPTANRVRSEMDRFVDSVLPGAADWFNGRPPAAQAGPPLNIWEDQEAVHIEAELPGMTRDDVDVSVLNRVLTIAGRRTIRVPEGATVIHRERQDTRFNRSIHLPEGIDDQRIEANMENGVLTLTLAKAAQAQPRRIEVQSGNNQPSLEASTTHAAQPKTAGSAN